MVLDGFLEDFLQGPCAAWGKDDTSKGKCQDVVLAQAVLKELGDVCRKRCRGLMPIEPGGNAQTGIFLLRILVDDAEG